MTKSKIAISLPKEQLARVRREVRAGRANRNGHQVGTARIRTAAGIVLDAGALIALDRGDRRIIALLQRALTQGRTFRVPVGAVGQAWRNGRVQVTLARISKRQAAGWQGGCSLRSPKPTVFWPTHPAQAMCEKT